MARPSGIEHSEAFTKSWAELQSRAPENEIEPSLTRMMRLLDLMGHPERAYRTLHIAGTNGKTSTARIAEALLIEAGLRTGRLTSPHMHSPTERIALDGAPISEEAFVQAYEDVLPFAEAVDREFAQTGVRISMFEYLTAMQFQAFASAPVDVAIVEVGLGGRWDATNVIEPDVTVITPIAFDHQDYLGDTIEEIAGEKAGILKEGALAVIAAQQFPGALDELKNRCAELGVTAAIEGEQIGVLDRVPAVGGQMIAVQSIAARYEEIFVPLLGAHQAHNALLAIAAAEAILTGGDSPLDGELVRAGLERVTSPGRAEVVRQAPTILVDAAHNPAGAEVLVETVRESFRFTRTVGIVGILKEKDASEILAILEPLFDIVVITESISPRAIPTDLLAMEARDIFGDEDRVIECASLPDAIQAAVDAAEQGGDDFSGVVATGSITLAAEVRQLLGRAGE
ncbi:bifunctional folylpolyglutamate synthase/dihydrofolate synthase [Dermabacter sp. p3-SID358]|uniref:bifunctional folylpolyglutamate synthase/dihydrofolate synthase n=1 Tax=Dermabacter sp. p3-SID358 TaxID=2916114 RepID=UPI0021A68142|nr:folylpolyglutamate synthase/dihydrofolate synthase family protein [Dermabacter sp. p3-SID358]MCT1866238.1 bifunctional folylpolyglutamate synthase/dihydrofolate synthase [Dermabacter sp. p3-SID358]